MIISEFIYESAKWPVLSGIVFDISDHPNIADVQNSNNSKASENASSNHLNVHMSANRDGALTVQRRGEASRLPCLSAIS